jgi:hypothetical protein
VIVESGTKPESASARKKPSRASSRGAVEETCANPMTGREPSRTGPQAASEASVASTAPAGAETILGVVCHRPHAG